LEQTSIEEEEEEEEQDQNENMNEGDTETDAAVDPGPSWMRDGSARLTFAGGQTYEGEVHGGRMHGRGTYQWPDGAIYEGTFEHGAISGEGRYSWSDGSIYEGSVRAGKRHGQGTFHCGGDCPSWYEGQWEDGQRSGSGIIYYDEKKTTWYKGQWQANLRHGRGYMRYASGNIYDGEWKANLKHGQGSMTWKDRHQRYRGAWAADKPDGFGEYVWLELHGSVANAADISREQQRQEEEERERRKRDKERKARQEQERAGNGGSRPNSRMSVSSRVGTLGRTSTPSSAAERRGGGYMRSTQRQLCNHYKGCFRGGEREGIGKFFFSDGAIYDGEWASDMKQGNGTYTFADGSVYEGAFARDRMLGKRPRPGQEVKRANPREVKWCVDDILAPIAKSYIANEEAERVMSIGSPIKPALRAKKIRQLGALESNTLNSAVLRRISRIKDIYKKYSAMSAHDVAGMFNMTTGELVYFCRQCHLPSSLLGPVVIGRLLRTMRQQQKRNVVRTREKREQREFAASERERAQLAASIPGTEDESGAATKLQAIQRGRASRAAMSASAAEHSAAESPVEEPPVVGEQAMVEEKDGDCHDTGRPLLFREFVEMLVRLSYARYDSEVPVPPPREGEEACAIEQVEETPGNIAATRFERMWREHVEPFAMETGTDSVHEALHSLEAKKSFASSTPAGSALRAVFNSYATAASENEDDVTLTVAQCYALLSDCLLFESDRPHSSNAEVQKVFSAVCFDDEEDFAGDSAAYMDITFAQFTEIVVRLASRMYTKKEAPSLVDKAVSFISEFFADVDHDAE